MPSSEVTDFDSDQGKLSQYASGNIDQTLSKFIDEKPCESYTNDSVCNHAVPEKMKACFFFLKQQGHR